MITPQELHMKFISGEKSITTDSQERYILRSALMALLRQQESLSKRLSSGRYVRNTQTEIFECGYVIAQCHNLLKKHE